MSLRRCRNIYTLSKLGARERLKRRQESDPFEKDPFKIQSYNFRYAERPSYPVATLPPRTTDADKANDCQTFFYNYEFPHSNINIRKSSVFQNIEPGLNLKNFQEYRRKKFLQESTNSCLRDNSKTTTPPSKTYASKILNIYNGRQNTRYLPNLLMRPTYMQTIRPNYVLANYENINTRNNVQIKRPLTPQPQATTENVVISSPSSDSYVKRRSLSSGCEININIKSLEDNSLQDNVNIKIETDSICRNLNIGTGNQKQNTFEYKNKDLERFHSTETFIVDKSRSKYGTLKCQESQEFSKKVKKSERIKELTSIYSSQALTKSNMKRGIKSSERLPSLIPVTPHYDPYHLMKNNLIRSKTSLEKPKSRVNKCTTNNILQNSPYNNSFNSSTKRLYSIKQTPAYGSRHSLPGAFKGSEYKMNSNAKLPIKVNINVYTDNLKLLNV